MSNPPTCLAVDYGSTISTGTIDHLIGQKPVDPEAASALRALHDDHRLRIILASNTQPHETRWPALQKAGIDNLFSVVLLSYPLGVRKPDPRFYELACATLGVEPEESVFLDDLGVNLKPARALGMHTIKVTDPEEALAELARVLGHPVVDG